MINLKVFYVICFATPCIMALSFSKPESFHNMAESEFATFEEQGDSDVKINWGPVWDDNQGDNEFVIRKEDKEEENCDAPNGLGLKNLIQQIDRLLPKEEIKKIVQTFSDDPQIKALQAFAKSSQVQQKLKTIVNSQEYQIIKDYACRVLHLDLNNYYHLTRSLKKPSIRGSDVVENKGIRGLLNAVEAILPEQKLRELYENLMKTDEELVKAVEHVKSEEFHQLLLNLKNNVPEYQELRKQIIDIGVPVEAMRNIVAKALGWSEDFDILF